MVWSVNEWLKHLPLSNLKSHVQNVGRVCIKRIQTSVTKLKPTLVKYLGWGLLYMGKPFTCIGNWFWKKHRAVLDWNNK
jgi:hypothetical protein